MHVIELTKAGEAAFVQLAEAARAFDRRLRRNLSNEQLGELGRLLQQLVANINGDPDRSPQWAGLIERRP